MAVEVALQSVIEAYPAHCQPTAVRYLADAGGFSGARFWHLETPAGPMCLRKWPKQHPSPSRLEFIHSVLWHVVQERFTRVPLPIERSDHRGYSRHDGCLWQLEPWIPGRADFHSQPTLARLSAAMQALAEFHLAAASFPLPDASPAASPGVIQRLKKLRGLLGGGIDRIQSAAADTTPRELASGADALWKLFPRRAKTVLQSLEAAAQLDVALQPCIRDVWHDHVFFLGNRVTGFVDFGALRADNVATDIARLLGSLVGDDAAGWAAGIEAYQSARFLTPAERKLIQAFDQSTALMAGVNWIDWICCQGREFSDLSVVQARLEDHVKRLSHLTEAIA